MKVRAGFPALLLILLAPVSSAQEGTARELGTPLLTAGEPADVDVDAEQLQAAAIMVQHAPTTVTAISARSGKICYHDLSKPHAKLAFNHAAFSLIFWQKHACAYQDTSGLVAMKERGSANFPAPSENFEEFNGASCE